MGWKNNNKAMGRQKKGGEWEETAHKSISKLSNADQNCFVCSFAFCFLEIKLT